MPTALPPHALPTGVQAEVAARMAAAYTELRASLVALHARFAGDSDDVQREWLAWLRRADATLLEALATCVRRSLAEVARALQSEARGGGAAAGAAAEVLPVFLLSVSLDASSGRVELQPSLQQLSDAVLGACNAAVASLAALPRLQPEVLAGCAAAGTLAPCLRCWGRQLVCQWGCQV